MLLTKKLISFRFDIVDLMLYNTPRLARFVSKESFDVRKNKVPFVKEPALKANAYKLHSGYDRGYDCSCYFTRAIIKYS